MRFNALALPLAVAASLAITAGALVACGDDDGEDRPGVEVIDSGSGSVSGSGSGTGSGSGSGTGTGSASASGSGSGSGTGDPSDPSGSLGGYEPASDVSNHARVVLDIAEINALLGADTIDFEAIQGVYAEGGNSPSGDGFRTIQGFASTADRSEPIWDDYVDYYGDPAWLDTFVTSALEGTGPFEGEADAVRRQGVQKGIQNQVMIAWVIHELVAAMQKAEDGNFDAAEGAPHNWDEAWAFYHGEDPDNGPYSTAVKRGENFGTGNAVNEAILAAMIEGRDALLAEDAEGAQQAMDEIIRQVTITYVQAAIRYGAQMEGSVAEGDLEAARIQQAEGWSFFRVIEPIIAAADADAAATVDGFLNLENEPAEGSSDGIREALEGTYEDLGISVDQIGELQ